MKVKSESEVVQSCPTLCDPTEVLLNALYSVLTSVVREGNGTLLQARVLEWVAIAFSVSLF